MTTRRKRPARRSSLVSGEPLDPLVSQLLTVLRAAEAPSEPGGDCSLTVGGRQHPHLWRAVLRASAWLVRQHADGPDAGRQPAWSDLDALQSAGLRIVLERVGERILGRVGERISVGRSAA